LNDFLDIPSFQMETVQGVSSSVRPGDWATSLDLTDGYFHLPIAPWFRKFLRFVVDGKIYISSGLFPSGCRRPLWSSRGCFSLWRFTFTLWVIYFIVTSTTFCHVTVKYLYYIVTLKSF
jgi:hypothetical protein